MLHKKGKDLMYSKIFFTQSRHSNIHHEFWVFCCESHTADSDQHVSGSIQTQAHSHPTMPIHTHTHSSHPTHHTNTHSRTHTHRHTDTDTDTDTHTPTHTHSHTQCQPPQMHHDIRSPGFPRHQQTNR